MAYVNIQFGNYSFEENPGFITWLQLFLIKLLEEQEACPEWIQELKEEWELNAQIDIYKYFFDADQLDTNDKKNWASSFIQYAINKLDSMSLDDFSQFINTDIDANVNFERIKKILLNIKLMLDDKEPLPTVDDQNLL